METAEYSAESKYSIRWFLAAEYSVSAESQNSCFGRTLVRTISIAI
jgi:hypothetical protein